MPTLPGMGGMSGKLARAAARRMPEGDLPPQLAALAGPAAGAWPARRSARGAGARWHEEEEGREGHPSQAPLDSSGSAPPRGRRALGGRSEEVWQSSSAWCGWARRSSRPTGSSRPTAAARGTVGSSRSSAPTSRAARRAPQPETVLKVDNDRAVHWLQQGAQPTERVEKLLKDSGAWATFKGAPEAPAAPADAAASAEPRPPSPRPPRPPSPPPPSPSPPSPSPPSP